MSESNSSDQPVERTEESVTEKVVQTPTADEGGPLGNVTNAVTGNAPVDTVVERSEEKVTETPVDPSSDDS